jgi:hypothetical protein
VFGFVEVVGDEETQAAANDLQAPAKGDRS